MKNYIRSSVYIIFKIYHFQLFQVVGPVSSFLLPAVTDSDAEKKNVH